MSEIQNLLIKVPTMNSFPLIAALALASLEARTQLATRTTPALQQTLPVDAYAVVDLGADYRVLQKTDAPCLVEDTCSRFGVTCPAQQTFN